MFSGFARQGLSTKNYLNITNPVVLGDNLQPSCRETGACNDNLLCEVELFVPITGAPAGSYITLSTDTDGGATVTVVESAANNATILFSNEGSNTNFIAFTVEVRDSGGTILNSKTYGLSNSSSQTQLEWSNLPTCSVAPFIIVSPTFVTVGDCSAQQWTITITSNTTWRVEEPAPLDWIAFTIQSGGTGGNNGSGNGIVTISALQNDNQNGRVGYVNVVNTSVSPDIIKQITIEQGTCDPSGGNP